MVNDMLAYYNMVKENHICIMYNGPIWAEVVEEMGETVKKRLEIDVLPLGISQSVFSIFVEQMYNILHYAAEKNQFINENSGKEFDVASGVFILGAQEKKYFIQCGNKILTEQMDNIRERIDQLNAMNKDEMRKYYKERLKADNDNPESKGAGLGLIEIARRASSKIEYSFEKIDEHYSFFTLFVHIG